MAADKKTTSVYSIQIYKDRLGKRWVLLLWGDVQQWCMPRIQMLRHKGSIDGVYFVR